MAGIGRALTDRGYKVLLKQACTADAGRPAVDMRRNGDVLVPSDEINALATF